MRRDVTEAVPAPPATDGPAVPQGGARSRPGWVQWLIGGLRRLAALWLFAVLVVVWWVWSAGSTSTFFPPLKDIVHQLYELWIVGDAKKNLGSSLQNFAFGYLIAGLAGVALGTLLWMIRSARDAVSPFLYFLYVLPAPVLIPA